MKKPWHIRLGIWAGVALLLAWSLLPIYWTLASSLTPTVEFNARPLHLFPEHPTGEHYLRLLGVLDGHMGGVDVAGEFRLALFNSILTSGAATVLCVLMSLLAAYAFARLNFPGREVLFYAVVGTMAVPGYAVLIPLFRLMVSLRQIDAYLGVTLIYVSAFLPLCLWLLKGVMDTLPRSLEEAARIDGASHMRILFSIIAPIAAPGLTAAAILTFLGAWGQYVVPLVFSPKDTKPLTVLIPEFAGKNFVDYGLIMAGGSIAIAVPCLLVIFLNRYLISGLLAGSTK
ncbi:ABC transporter permease subunit [Mesorhizobium sp. M2A.F.Ca.ET.037.01.1.1]|uniref:carbohydrate ABC transporter permease n=1 Tax=unclassified Mesorhizobium TaxID=325217 RepID=UPI000F74C19F|nr:MULTISPECIES: carbohydrate ABC transporter permease [unclassified Mesorhizobium]RUX99770.1 ABC transporter permease subunit [Mesorhizobium sp. M2A.F.Ca.ET.040.01.1.1]RVC69903.1 ABC transporter permease subunit [Mesorhizobium sp. M00.F.Ca.ET.038.03.1.1]RVC81315.1 ABC transporter permease subunit [Mesorhizobium sp. M2A.F.Ca.ET.046.02.1.1]AZO36406.1 carbohydrate ABC transporter permease [Mesorhizobium sp. M2A.F.Ca.ET.046.03.2.1]RUX12293.1 ABC transporter permease subunit [Mesorhizobium sp. M2A